MNKFVVTDRSGKEHVFLDSKCHVHSIRYGPEYLENPFWKTLRNITKSDTKIERNDYVVITEWSDCTHDRYFYFTDPTSISISALDEWNE